MITYHILSIESTLERIVEFSKRPYFPPLTGFTPPVPANFSITLCTDSLNGPYAPSDRYPAYETPRADSYGCYCVPFDQCLPHEVARKEDGIAGIDPRNLNRGGKPDIEAIGLDEVVITDGNGTIVSHHKKTDADDKATKSRRRRDAPQDKSDAEPVSAFSN